jgi:hypothetical protein
MASAQILGTTHLLHVVVAYGFQWWQANRNLDRGQESIKKVVCA